MPALVALNMPGGPAFVDALRRTWDAGDAVLPVDVRLPTSQVEQLVNSLGASEIIDADGVRQRLAHGRPTQEGDALVVATSGSTGIAKGVVHTHASVAASAELTSRRLGVTATDHWLACIPVAHIGGLSVITRALHMRTGLTVHGGFDADLVHRAAMDGANLISVVPTVLRRLDATQFKTILLGGAAPPEERPSNAVITYGSTETGSGIVYDHLALDSVELRVDQAGEVWVKSPTLLRCYRDEFDPRDPDGWYATGDAGALGTDGRLDVFGRIAEVINTGGEKVWPAAVEAALRLLPGVGEALVFGVADDEWGQRVCARIEALNGTQIVVGEALEQLRERLPAYALPKEIVVVDRLARTTNGKVDRRESARL